MINVDMSVNKFMFVKKIMVRITLEANYLWWNYKRGRNEFNEKL